MLLPFLAQSQTPAPDAADETPKIEPLKQSITVTEHVSTDAPASIDILGRPEIQQYPGVNVDDRLRNVPGFSLFRRASGVTSNPTTLGVSLRGLGSSGASRSLVLWDGIPVNSPFGGWVYWERLTPELIERIEISRGASTSVFGDKAMGGAITMFSRPAQPWYARLYSNGGFSGAAADGDGGAANPGKKGTAELGGGFSHVFSGKWGASVDLRSFTTDGYYIVPASVRGRADAPAGSQFVAGNVRLDYNTQVDHLFLKLDILAEERANGTVLVKNSTGLGTIGANWSRQLSRDTFSVIGYHTRESYHALFSTVTNNRNTETLTDAQEAPSNAVGAAAFWRHDASRWSLLGGTDFSRVQGSSTDHFTTLPLAAAGGKRFQRALFGQFNAPIGPARVFLGMREDFLGFGQSFASPSGGITVGKGLVRFRASAYRSFRAPTLNELYRLFRVGNIVTLANGDLVPEKLWAAEAGFDVVGETRRFSFTMFRNSVEDAITNVTVARPPGAPANQVTRQRQNAANSLTYGIEASAQQSWRQLRGIVSYLYADSQYRVPDTAPLAILNDNRVQQVPRHQGSATLVWQWKGTFVSGSMRSYSNQFEDDRNTRSQLMPGFAVFQIAAQQRLRGSLSANIAFENMFDRVYLTSGAALQNIGSPRLFRVGLRWDGKVR